MSDPNVEPVKLIDFDMETLSNVSLAIALRVDKIRNHTDFGLPILNKEVDRLLEFNTQVLNAFSRVKSEQKLNAN